MISDTNYPSIFNDVIGPVMRGPSSSHSAAALRIGRMARNLMGDEINSVLVEFDPNGSLATTHDGQGSDMGLCGGLMGWEADDDRLLNAEQIIQEEGIQVEYKVVSYGAIHPNTYKLTLVNDQEQQHLTAISTGGGMIEVIEINGIPLSISGGCHETLLYGAKDISVLRAFLDKHIDADAIHLHGKGDDCMIQIQTILPIEHELLEKLQAECSIGNIKQLPQVLPVPSPSGIEVPFLNCEQMLAYNADRDLPLWELALHYESARAKISHEEILDKMCALIRIMRSGIEEGIQGTEYEDRILPCQTPNYHDTMKSGILPGGELVNHIILNISALMEVKSSMGVIIAAPTAGACAALPGTLIAAVDALDASEEQAAKAMLAGAMIGVFIAERSTFAAEVGGCQAEGGSASGMAAAALVTLSGGSTQQAVGAASMALQNCLGMICDPVANRVEVPCLGKNLIAGMNALSSSNVALANYASIIPLDEVIATMDTIGRTMPCELRCTGLGGLSITQTSKEIEAKLQERKCCSTKGNCCE